MAFSVTRRGSGPCLLAVGLGGGLGTSRYLGAGCGGYWNDSGRGGTLGTLGIGEAGTEDRRGGLGGGEGTLDSGTFSYLMLPPCC